ncbi:MAG: hypothetical protein M1828_001272 [Chrysothrix sp. TS-e1954]|nr:MAG: hypothetical protein M1828_001272 [Chrysothrix sp. TS-e1954]
MNNDKVDGKSQASPWAVGSHGQTRGQTRIHPQGNKKSRSSKWPTNAEIRANSASKQLPFADNNSDVPSNQADNGAQTGKLRVEAEEGYEPGLADWEGNWMPPPAEWEYRSSLQNTDKRIHERVIEWFDRVDLSVDNISGFNAELVGDICPLYWIPETIDGDDRTVWWGNHIKFPGLDLNPAVQPFWILYNREVTTCSDVLEKMNVPDANADPRDNDRTKLEQTAQMEIDKFDKNRDRGIQKARSERNAARKAHIAERAAYVPPINEHSPQANVYLRTAAVQDIEQIAAIYNHWITNTICCPEGSELSVPQMHDRWTDITDARLPFLVAVDRASNRNRHNPNKRAGANGGETISGFAFADDYNDDHGMYRYTVEIEIFVKPNMLFRGIGKTLMDKLTSVLDPHHTMLGGYDFKDYGNPNHGPGGARVVEHIIANVAYDADDNSRYQWVRAWLVKWGLEQCGDYPCIGHKLQKRVSQAVFMKKTGCDIDPSHW